jgi:anti-sigma regulatory factor (Ser/Thr protein kinase)
MLDLRTFISALCLRLIMADDLTLKIKNDFAAVQSANAAASRWLEKRHTAADLRYFASLAIEEIATNCIKYAYHDKKEHVIEIHLLLSPGALIMTVRDDGQPFDPLTAPGPDLRVAAEDRPIGGLGIYLLRQMSDRIEYVREGNKNRLTLWKTARS